MGAAAWRGLHAHSDRSARAALRVRVGWPGVRGGRGGVLPHPLRTRHGRWPAAHASAVLAAVPEVGFEPTSPYGPKAFKAPLVASFSTRAAGPAYGRTPLTVTKSVYPRRSEDPFRRSQRGAAAGGVACSNSARGLANSPSDTISRWKNNANVQ